MASDWETMLREASAAQSAADRQRADRAASEADVQWHIEQRIATVREEYTRIATSFSNQLKARGLIAAQTYTFYRSKAPMFAPREKTLDMVLVGKVGDMWYRVGDGNTGPTGTHARALAVAQNLPPMIIAPFPRTERIAYVVYENATTSSEAVVGLDDLLANNRAFGATEPEALTKSLMLGLAHWAAMHWPDLKL